MMRILACVIAGALAGSTKSPQPITYRAQWVDGVGATQRVNFDGQIAGGVLSGTVKVNGIEFPIAGSIKEGTITGDVRYRSGVAFASFVATHHTDKTVTVNASVGQSPVSVKISDDKLPSAVVTALKADLLPNDPVSADALPQPGE